jgi:hypothetical protein
MDKENRESVKKDLQKFIQEKEEKSGRGQRTLQVIARKRIKETRRNTDRIIRIERDTYRKRNANRRKIHMDKGNPERKPR